MRAMGGTFDLVLCDVRMPKMDGVTFLRRYRADGGQALMIMMSAYGSEDSALAAMREGAYDYLHKPFRPDEVTMTLRKAEEREKLRREVEALRTSLGAGAAGDLVVSESRAMRDLLELATRVARHNTTVLITGRERHRQGSAGPRHPPDEPAERAELHRDQLRRHSRAPARERALRPRARGAFTGATADRAGLFELAHEGTLLLDEIGDLPLDLQAKLLRVLEEGEIRRVGGRERSKVDVRVIAATAKPLEAAVERGEFRADLFYRLNVVQPAPPAAPRAAGRRAAAAHPLRAPGRHAAGPPGEHHARRRSTR